MSTRRCSAFAPCLPLRSRLDCKTLGSSQHTALIQRFVFNLVYVAMQLRYYLNENGKRVYTLESSIEDKNSEDAKPTFSAHPARFSPDDKYSEQRIKCKRRFGQLKTQVPPA